MRVSKFSPQVIGEQGCAHLVESLPQFLGGDLEGHPSVIATGQMIALSSARPTLTLLAARQLFEVSMQFFDLPAHGVRVLSDVRGYRLIQVISNDPVNVAVRGDYLEQPHLERDFLQLDDDALYQSVSRPLDFIEVEVAAFLAQTHQAIALQCGEESPTPTVNQLQILGRRVPGIEQNCAGFQLLVVYGLEKHLSKMVVLALVVNVRGVHPIINRVKVSCLAIAVHQIDHPDAFDGLVFRTAILPLHQFDEARVALVLNAVIGDQKGFGAILNPPPHQFPQLMGPQVFLPQKVVDDIVTHPVQMVGQIGAGVIEGRAQQILDIPFLADHAIMFSHHR